MITYSRILGLWKFVLAWLMQANPSQLDVIAVTSCFVKLGPAVAKDTGLKNFHELRLIDDRKIGPATCAWLDEVRPHLAKVYIYFDHHIELLVNPTGRTTSTK